MRAIHKVRLDKVRPAVILTRQVALNHLTGITVAPVTSTVRGIETEVPVGRANGLDHGGVVNCDAVVTVPAAAIGDFIGLLGDEQDHALTIALHAAFDLV